MRRTLPVRTISKRDRNATPKIIYLIGLLAYGAWGAWGYILLNRAPDNLQNKLVFLGAAFLALFLTFIFLFYQMGKISSGRAPNVVFYPATRRALFAAIFFSLLGVMKLINIFNFVNALLLGAAILLLEIQASR